LEAKTGCVAAVPRRELRRTRGCVFVVMGLSGSGKSTLVRCFSGLIESTAGQVLIDGEEHRGLPAEWLRDLRRDRVSMVFQHFGSPTHRRRARQLASARGTRKVEGGTPRACRRLLDLVVSAARRELPRRAVRRMQQRVGLARALANDPEILLFD